MATALTNSDGEDLVLQEGESANVVVVFHDMNGDDIPKSSLVSLVCTQYDRDTRDVINGRDNQNVLDANNGTVASNGTLTLRLGPSDTVLVGEIGYGQSQTHCLLFRWTWSDGIETRTGKCGPLTFRIENLVEPT